MAAVVIAPDSFKGSLRAREVAEAIAEGWRSERPHDTLALLPQADGGEGTLEAVAAAVPGAVTRSAGTVTGPDGRPVEGTWLELPDGSAVVELAQTSGLPLMARLDPLGATTRGLGETIAAALDGGATRVTIGLGGSASTDGGTGALRALGLRILDAEGRDLPDGGGALARAARVDRSGLRPIPGGVTLLSDVTAPLLGPAGAAAVFGPQKGADARQVAALDAALARLDALLGGDPEAPGAGAAGGTGYGFAAAYGARIVSGADRLAELSGLIAAIRSSDVLVSGEGRLDEQSIGGKVVGQLLRAAADAGVRAGVVAGQVAARPVGPDGRPVWTLALVDVAGSVAAAIAEPARWLRVAGARAARELV